MTVSGESVDLWWSRETPWPHRENDGPCTRCGLPIEPYHRHFWKPCLPCALRSVAAQALMATFGLDGHPWLYMGWSRTCTTCDGEGYMPCEDQDLSIMRMSGVCEACGASAFKLIHCVPGKGGDVEGSARHYEGLADHEVVVVAAPLVRSITETLNRGTPPSSGLEPTDDDWLNERPCPDCGYTIPAGYQHGRHPQPKGGSHVVCRFQSAQESVMAGHFGGTRDQAQDAGAQRPTSDQAGQIQ